MNGTRDVALPDGEEVVMAYLGHAAADKFDLSAIGRDDAQIGRIEPTQQESIWR
jgi:hypothetical protein